VVESVYKKQVTSPFFRDLGHEGNICNSYEMVRSKGELKPGCEISYVWETAYLFLKTKEALENDQVITVQPFQGLESELASLESKEKPSPSALAVSDSRLQTPDSRLINQ
jgi:hypothetical protein